MRSVFDPTKDKVNRAKHGVSLALAEVLFAGPRVSVADDRFDYNEVREVAFGLINNRLFVCVYADRDRATGDLAPQGEQFTLSESTQVSLIGVRAASECWRRSCPRSIAITSVARPCATP